MAKDKKSFIAYCDWGETFDMLSDEEAGQLIKHIFAYVNDKNPKLENRILEIAFKPIKLQLKRDLQKYETICAKNKENINKRWGKEKRANTTVYGRKNRNTKNTDNDNDNDIDIDNDIIKEKIYKKEIAFKKSIEPFIERYGKETCNNFFLYWTEPNKSKTKLKYEMEKTWDISRRLARWEQNKKDFNGNGKTEITKKYEQLG